MNIEEFIKQYIILFMLAVIAVYILLIWALLRLNSVIFKRIQSKQQGLHLLFFERLNAAAIIVGSVILVFSIFGGVDSIWKTLLGGTAIVSAVLAFAAQDVIKDILAGMMLSIHKPFEVGSRIELEDGTTGTVRDITMRHVVIQTIDTNRIVIPNSKLNSMCVRNYSYQTDRRAILFHFYVAYNSDVDKAMKVIRNAVRGSMYSIPGKETENGLEYGPVYFMAYTESSLRLDTTVYFDPITPSEVVISDINLRVNKALREYGIEIPYQYVNVIHKNKMM